MKSHPLFLSAALLLGALVATPAASADVAVRTCDTSTSCDDQVFVRASLVDCNVDYMKGGLGKPGSLRTDCVSN